MADFKPSQVIMFCRSFIPFIDTFNNANAEVAAGIIVAASEFHRNEWEPVLPVQIGKWMESLRDKEPRGKAWKSVLNNPFATPNFDRLIDDGYLQWVGDERHQRERPLEFTEKALERMREKKWVKEDKL